MIGEPGAIWIPSPYFTAGHGSFGKPRWIVIHGTASSINYTAQQTAYDFQKQPKSTHYVIGYDGTLVQCVDEANSAWGNGIITGPSGNAPVGGGDPRAPHDLFWDVAARGDPNMCTISIEHSRSSDNQSPLSNAQLARSFSLVSSICTRWGIPRHYADGTGGVTGHYSLEPTAKANCPGPYPWAQLFNYLGGISTLPTPYPGVFPNTGTFGTSGTPTDAFAGVAPPKTYVPLLDQVHETLIATPGFYGIALALDEAEQFPGWIDLTTPTTLNIAGNQLQIPDIPGTARSAGATISDNFVPFLIRGGLVVMGSVLFMFLLGKALLGPAEKILPIALKASG